MKLSPSLSGVVAILALALPVFGATAPQVQIFEVAAGVNGDSSAQCVGLMFATPDGDKWGPQAGEAAGRLMLVFFDAASRETGRFVFAADPPIGPADGNGFQSVLVATQAFVDLPGTPAADFILPAGLLAPAGGKVCLKANPANPAYSLNLCLSYGNFAGDTEADTGNPPSLSGAPAVEPPILGAKSLKRFRNFGLAYFGARQVNADFRLEAIEARNAAGQAAAVAEAPLVDQGRNLFFKETFQGNGRTCFTCHKPEIGFSLPPFIIAPGPPVIPPPSTSGGPPIQLPPEDPLFVADFAPALAQLENNTLLKSERALILENIDSFDSLPSFRGSPPLLNLKDTAPFGLSGETASLRDFSVTAVKQHFPKTLARNANPAAGPLDFRLPSAAELSAMEAFMSSLAIEKNLDLMMASAVFRGADPVQLRKGRDNFFGEGKCFLCHNGPALAEVDPSMVERGLVPNLGNHSFNTGVTSLAMARGFPGPHETERKFSTRPLIGASKRRAFFHDNSAGSLREAVQFYANTDEEFFGLSLAGLDILTAFGSGLLPRVDDLVAFIESLVEPAPECAGGLDCNQNGIRDACELRLYPEFDCNQNGIPDSCDLASGFSPDCNGNGIPDGCEPVGLFKFTSLNGSRGFETTPFENGAQKDGQRGSSLADGDLNGDQVDDLIIGLPGASPDGKSEAGAVYVIFGNEGLGASGSIDPAALDGRNGFAIRGATANDRAGFSVHCRGDVNGDGIDDLIIGCQPALFIFQSLPAKAFVVYGSASVGQSGVLDLASLNGANGFAIKSTGADFIGHAIVSAGDLNGDGRADLILGSQYSPSEGRRFAGQVYVIFGKAGKVSVNGTFDLATLSGANGFILQGQEFEQLGYNLVSGGDLNGDGFEDLVVGGKGAVSLYRYLYVLFGGPDLDRAAVHDIKTLVQAHGRELFSTVEASRPVSLAMAGDVNQDGFDDLIIGEPFADLNLDFSFEGYVAVIHGGATFSGGQYDLPAGRLLIAGGPNEFLGASVAMAGDLNRDGRNDLAFTGAAGFAYAVYGGPALRPGQSVNLGSLNGSNGAVIQLVPADGTPQFLKLSPTSVSDLNGDGIDDLALSADLDFAAGSPTAKQAFILFGPVYGTDCNSNGIPDSCDIESGALGDFNRNGVPDLCEPVQVAIFRRGDANADGGIDIADAVFALLRLFRQGLPALPCEKSADSNDDGAIDISDPIALLHHLFLYGPPPPAPYPNCGQEPTPLDSLRCDHYSCP